MPTKGNFSDIWGDDDTAVVEKPLVEEPWSAEHPRPAESDIVHIAGTSAEPGAKPEPGPDAEARPKINADLFAVEPAPAAVQTTTAVPDENGGWAWFKRHAPQTAETLSSIGESAKKIASDVTSGNAAAMSPYAPAEATLNAITGTGATIYGGLKGLGRLATGGTTEQATKDIQQAQQDATYQPRSGLGQVLTAAPNVVMAPLRDIGATTGRAIAGNAGEAIGTALPDIAATILGGRAALKSPLARYERPLPTPGAEPPIAAAARGAGATPGSVGAAGASFTARAQEAGIDRTNPALYDAIRRHEGTPDFNPVAADNHIKAASLPVPMQLSEGQAIHKTAGGNAELDPALQTSHWYSKEKNERAQNGMDAVANQQNQHLIDNLDVISDRVAPDVHASNLIEAGQQQIDNYKAKDAPIKADVTAKYDALEHAVVDNQPGWDTPVDGGVLHKVATETLDKKNLRKFLPSIYQSELDDIAANAGSGRQMTFGERENLRKNLNDDIRKASGSEKRAMQIVRDAVDNDAVMQSPLTAPAARQMETLSQEARAAHKARMDTIGADPAYAAAIEGTVTPDNYLKKFVLNGTYDQIKQMRANLPDEHARQVMAYALMKRFGEAAHVPEGHGNFAPATYRKAIKDARPTVQDIFTVPDVHGGSVNYFDKLQDVGDVADLVRGSGPTGGTVNTSNTTPAMVNFLTSYGAHTAAGIGGSIGAAAGGPGGAALGAAAGGAVGGAIGAAAKSKVVLNPMRPGAGINKNESMRKKWR